MPAAIGQAVGHFLSAHGSVEADIVALRVTSKLLNDMLKF